ncbi:MAG: hypothetical protein IJR50_05555 [Treponema sp.]|nr:hypothetical protein [Treponema sp.]
MGNYFLSNVISKLDAFKSFHKKFFHIGLLMCVFVWNAFAQVIYSSNDISNEVESVRSQFFTGQNVNIEEYELFLDTFLDQCNLRDDNALIQILDSFNLYSNIQTLHAAKESSDRINKFEKQIHPYVQRSKNPNVIHEYASYLYSKISWSKNSFSVIEELPYWYKKNMRLENTGKAELFYAMWLINAVNSKESNWISYIKQKESLIDNLELKRRDLFNCYLAYSMFYMKTLDTKKGFEYLNKAEQLYPNNYFSALLEINYKRGRYSW